MKYNRKLLITGGLGYIGSHAVVYFEQAGYSTVIIDNLSNAKLKVFDNIEKILGYRPKFYNIDLLDIDRLEEIFKNNNFEGVLHFAGLKAVGESCQYPIFYFKNNICGSINLFEMMEKYGVKNIIFSSSATVYDLSFETNNKKNDLFKLVNGDVILKRGLKETDKVGNTTNPYGKSKWVIEELLKDLSKFNGFNVVVLRYFNPIGAHPSGLLGEDPDGIPNNLTPYIIKVLLGELPYLRIFGGDYPTIDGTGSRDYIDINDLIKGHLKAYDWLKNQKKKGFFEVFNLGVGKSVSVLELVKLVENISGKRIAYKIVERRQGDVAMNYCNSDKAKKILGRKPEIELKDSIKNILKFYGIKF